jgi:hypothetical protein
VATHRSAWDSPRFLFAILEPSVRPTHTDREDEEEISIERRRVGGARHPRVFLCEGFHCVLAFHFVTGGGSTPGVYAYHCDLVSTVDV